MAKRLLSLIVVGGALTFLASCASDAGDAYFGTTKRAGKELTTFYTNNGSEPEYLDPGLSTDSASSTLVFNMFEGLTSYHPKDLHPTQAGAIRWEQSDDNRVFRFHLRPEARWSDGKPVTARDYEYAWKRVLRPRTASRAQSNLYVLANGELFGLGKLLVTKTDVDVHDLPGPNAAIREKLAKGAAVEVLARSPMKVASAVPPLPEVPAGARLVTYSKADEKNKTPERLSIGSESGGTLAANDGGWKGAEVEVLARGGAVECNGAADHWFHIQRNGTPGWLPGCMLGSVAKAPDGYALVMKHARVPTYDARPLPPEKAVPDPVGDGFVRASDLVEDDSVVGVRASDDLTLDVELERPTPYFLDLTGFVTLMPVRKDIIEAFEARGESELWVRPENIVVNGPFTLDTWRFRYEITMKPNPYYYDTDKLKIRRIVWFEVESYHATMDLYKAGDLDTIGDNLSLPSEYLDFLAQKKDFQRNSYLATYWYELNTKKSPTNDVRVRRALDLAVDKKELVEKITRGGQAPATHYVPDFTGQGYSDQVAADRAAGIDPFATPDTVFNPERGRELLKEAGYEVVKEGDEYRAKGFPPLEILYNTSEGHKQLAVAIQDMWKRHLGISVTLRNEEWKVMLKNVRDGNFQVVRSGWVADYNHPQTWLEQFVSTSPNNRTAWSDGVFDQMLHEAAATPDPKESIRRYRLAEKRAMDGMARIPLYFYTKATLLKPWVKGYYGHGRDVHLARWLWIDPDWRNHPENTPAYVSPDFPTPGRIAAP